MTDERDPATRSRTDPSDAPVEHHAPGLRATVVSYEDRPDRCTIYPADAPGSVRMVTWLSADAAAFVRTEEMR